MIRGCFTQVKAEDCFDVVGLSMGVEIGIDGGSVHGKKKCVVVFSRHTENK